MKLFKLLFLILLSQSISAQIKFKETFKYLKGDDNIDFQQKYVKLNALGSLPFHLKDKIDEDFYKRYKGSIISHTYDSSFFLTLSADPDFKKRQSSWLNTKKSYPITPQDTLFFWAGNIAANFPPPDGDGAPRTDTVEFWISKTGPDTTQMLQRVASVCIFGNDPIWRPFAIPLKDMQNENTPVYLGIRYHHKNFGYNPGQTGQGFWIDDITIGQNINVGIGPEKPILKKFISSIAPNPASTQIRVEFETLNNLKDPNLIILTSSGQIVKEIALDKNLKSYEVLIHDLNNGLYFIGLMDGNDYLDMSKVLIRN